MIFILVAAATFSHFLSTTPISENQYFQGYGLDMPADADAASFEFVGGIGDGPNEYYAKDKNHVYDNGAVVYNADPATFIGVYNSAGILVCVRDRDHLWFFIDYPHDIARNDAVLATGGYCKTREHVYMGADLIESADAESFIGLNSVNYGGYAKDKHQVYYMGFPVHGADVLTFEIVHADRAEGDFDAKDKNHKYTAGQSLEGAKVFW